MTEPEWHEDVKTSSKITLVVVDMQKLFLTEKKSPWMNKKLLSIIPNIEKLIRNSGVKNVIFTQFTPPKNWQKEQNSWQTYYKINQKITPGILGTDAYDLIDDFIPHIPNSVIVRRKKSASIFMAGNFHSVIKKKSTKILIFTGVETDYCVLSSVLDAIHLGYYVIVVMDACASSKNQGQKHARGIFDRFPEQLWVISTNDLINHFL
ncbi:MAG: cysteine hydrolase [Nitrosopumilus sp.]|nr:cysteine hydrolase [Nitrosopumilus sp.]MDH3341118.1 cysteine hydrolase [Nitrosopumilus sp.]